MTNVKCRNKSEGPNPGIRKPNGRELSHAEPGALDYNHDATWALAAAKCSRSAPSLFVIHASKFFCHFVIRHSCFVIDLSAA